jgi:hypothetical protein
MKRILLLLAILLITTPNAHGALKVIGKGDAMRLDPSAFPPKYKAAYDVLKVKCIKCHTLERTIVAVNTGIAPVTNLLFDRSATKAYGMKMIRKPDSNMNLQEVKVCVELLNFLLDEAAKK